MAAEVFSCLVQNENDDESKQCMEFFLDAGLIPAIIEACDRVDKETPRSLTQFYSNVTKYHAEILPTVHDIAETCEQRAGLRSVLFGSLIICSLDPKTARFILPVVPYMERYLAQSIEPGDDEERAFLSGHHSFNFKRMTMDGPLISYVPCLNDAACLILLNLPKVIPEFKTSLKNFHHLLEVRSSEAKNEGNKQFKDGVFDVAELLYSHAIEMGEPVKHKERVVFYSNRCECRIQQKKYKEALEDADKALKLDPKHQKSLSRKKRCLEHVRSK